MKKAAALALGLGLVSSTLGTTPDINGSCECEIADPCYQAVHILSSSICGNYGINEIPLACQDDDEALERACACTVPRTFSKATVAQSEIWSSGTNKKMNIVASTTNIVDTAIYEAGPHTASTDEGATVTHYSDLASDTGTEFQVVPPSMSMEYEIIAVDSGTAAPAKSHNKATLGDISSTFNMPGSFLTIVTPHSISPEATSVAYATAIRTYLQCPEDVEDCSSAAKGPYAATGTCPVSTNAYLMTAKVHSTTTNSMYSTRTAWTTEVYIVTGCSPYVRDCPYGSTVSSKYPMPTIAYSVHTKQPTAPVDYALSILSTVYITETVYYTEFHTVASYNIDDFLCLYDRSTPGKSSSFPVVTTTTEQSPGYPRTVITYPSEATDESYHPTWTQKRNVPLAVVTPSHPSSVIPNQKPGRTTHGAEVSAGASRIDAHTIIAAAGILIALLLE